MEQNPRLFCRAVILLVICAVVAPVVLAAGRGPSTTEERARAVRVARAHERDPLNKELIQDREWMLQWLIEIPDISVKVCGGLWSPVIKKKDYPIPLMIIGMFSSAAFVIEHPDKAGDFDAVQLAGVEGALKAYEAALKQEPEARLEFLDELLEKQKEGELPKQVRKLTKNCR